MNLPLKRKKSQVFIQPEVALSVCPQEVQPGCKLAPLTGLLHVKDNIHDIQVKIYDFFKFLKKFNDNFSIQRCDDALEAQNVPKFLFKNYTKKQVSYEYGTLDIDLFLKKLAQEGIVDIKIEQISESEGLLTRINLTKEDITININEKGSHVVCDGKQSSRLKLREALLSCVNKF